MQPLEKIFDFATTYHQHADYAGKQAAFVALNAALRNNQQDTAINILQQHADFINIGENALDFDSVGRFTTPFLLAATHGRLEFLRFVLNNRAQLAPNFLTISHCGQQILAHAVVQSHSNAVAKQRTTLSKDAYEANQIAVMHLLLHAAQADLTPAQYQQFIFGGGVWGRTPLYNALTESRNTAAATALLQHILQANLMPLLRRNALLQLKRSIVFYFSDVQHFDLFFSNTSAAERNAHLSLRDEVGNTALHFAQTPAIAQLLINADASMLAAQNITQYTPAQAIALTLAPNETNTPRAQTLQLLLQHPHNTTTPAMLQHNRQVRDRQNMLSDALVALAQQQPLAPKQTAALKQAWPTFTLGTQRLLSQYAAQFAAPLPPTLKQFCPPRGIENEFFLPRSTKQGLVAALALVSGTGLDPEPSLLINNLDEERIEINSAIIAQENALADWFMINDLAADLGASKNNTAGIHVHVGCKNKLFACDLWPHNAPTQASDAELQLAFLKTFLHVFTVARPMFDDVAYSGYRPDYAPNMPPQAESMTQFAHYFAAPHAHYAAQYALYLQQVNALRNLEHDIVQFTHTIGRDKYVTVALPKDAKGTLEVRELKSKRANQLGYSTQELHNIVSFVDAAVELSKQWLRHNAPQVGQVYAVRLDAAMVLQCQQAGAAFSQQLQALIM